MCKVCGNNRCIGRYLLHPKEVIMVPRLKAAELAVCKDRTFKMCFSPSSGEVFIRFKELHVIAGPEEDISDISKLPKVKVDVSDLVEQIKENDRKQEEMLEEMRRVINNGSYI